MFSLFNLKGNKKLLREPRKWPYNEPGRLFFIFHTASSTRVIMAAKTYRARKGRLNIGHPICCRRIYLENRMPNLSVRRTKEKEPMTSAAPSWVIDQHQDRVRRTPEKQVLIDERDSHFRSLNQSNYNAIIVNDDQMIQIFNLALMWDLKSQDQLSCSRIR
jgi:hypothetical protein